MPLFLIGTVFADLENMIERPLDSLRDLHWGWKIPINTVLILIACVWGSIDNEAPEGCQTAYDERC